MNATPMVKRKITRMVNGSRFNSVLLLPNRKRQFAILVLRVRVRFKKIEPKGSKGTFRDARGETVRILKWPAKEWEAFILKFERECQHAWRFRFCLTPSSAWHVIRSRGDRSSRLVPRVFTWLDIQDRRSNTHMTVQAMWTEKPFRSYKQGNTLTLDQRDVSLPKPGGQVVVVHEMGHYLNGSLHVSGADGSREAYGPPDSPARSQLMGAGMEMGIADAEAWSTRIKRHVRLPSPGWLTTPVHPVAVGKPPIVQLSELPPPLPLSGLKKK